MREIRPSSLEGGVRLIPHPYPYQSPVPTTLENVGRVPSPGAHAK